MARLIGYSLPLKVIEINRHRNRLILSERQAVQERRDVMKERLIEELQRGRGPQGSCLLDLRLRRLRRHRRRRRTRSPLRALLEPGPASERSPASRPGGRCLRLGHQRSGEEDRAFDQADAGRAVEPSRGGLRGRSTGARHRNAARQLRRLRAHRGRHRGTHPRLGARG